MCKSSTKSIGSFIGKVNQRVYMQYVSKLFHNKLQLQMVYSISCEESGSNKDQNCFICADIFLCAEILGILTRKSLY